ncbi:MAG: hypothetical protein A2745_03095 [Candidatus Harrisonbacteria bacterium RIFCSPHIGHO2_01_FULL_44_13]|uniref:Alpha-D-phosphohexomutase alpha/beta/alpha domain-containing protein n=1 Tax=Candidatus Harrisonbacteria bacterium RIFCSPLOWO2_01_FULL_44_18 TaxID=1798407 RepID=A0A1G1ZNR7_9BACT|nr:MAG: hypothetical protein A2745_03095 [Candidatus Harrisonbacteria bacterium RIFCSPHIGHO2_01_FULL_44_13]OGY65380.1 MAG: hypothetical protein A3A16_02945 [Candidatus Harrisonbacteria bacterium RIFCSPLOWO2_01_FULL_44_18]
MNPSIFKAYDIRGRYPEEIDEAAVTEIVKALAQHWQIAPTKSRVLDKVGTKRKSQSVIVVGHDARLSSPSLYKLVLKELRHSNVLKNMRMKVIEAGMITTPMLYFLVNKLKTDGGIMITASHNPKEYNGLKVVGPKAVPLSGREIKNLVIK